jgi:hypothetical protein
MGLALWRFVALAVPGSVAFVFGIIGISRGHGGPVLLLVTGAALITIASWRLRKSIRAPADTNQLRPGVARVQRLLGEELDPSAVTEADRNRARRAVIAAGIGTLCLFAVSVTIGIAFEPGASRSAMIRHAMVAVGIFGLCLLVIGYAGLAVIVVRRRSRSK